MPREGSPGARSPHPIVVCKKSVANHVTGRPGSPVIVIGPVKRPAKRRQQSATQADEALDAAIAIVQTQLYELFNSMSNLRSL